MSAPALTQFLVDITRGHRTSEFAADPEAVLAASPLDDRMRTAIREQDIGTLWRAGAHPMALMYFARGCGWGNERYYRCISKADLTTADRVDAALPLAHAPAQTRR
jgi:hypothetical protein